MSSCVRLSSVCHLHVTFVHLTQAIEIFGNIFISYDSFLTRRMVGKEGPLLPEILGQLTPVGSLATTVSVLSCKDGPALPSIAGP